MKAKVVSNVFPRCQNDSKSLHCDLITSARWQLSIISGSNWNQRLTKLLRKVTSAGRDVKHSTAKVARQQDYITHKATRLMIWYDTMDDDTFAAIDQGYRETTTDRLEHILVSLFQAISLRCNKVIARFGEMILIGY